MNRPRFFIILAILLVLLTAGAAVLVIFTGQGTHTPDQNLPKEDGNNKLWGAFILPMLVVIFLLSLLPILRIMRGGKLKNMLPATARVVKVRDTGSSLTESPWVSMTLAVTPPGGVTFHAEGKALVPRLQTSLVQPGIRAEVKYDPKDLSKVEVVSLDLPGAGAPAVSAWEAPNTPASRLEVLDGLRAKGLITLEEYQQKRAEILKEL